MDHSPTNTATLTRDEAAPPESLAGAAPIKLLLVEDDDLDAELLIRRLVASEDHAFQVTRVSGLRAALRELAYGDFDCIVLDLSLPDASGLSGCDTLLAHPQDLPIVILTGSDDADTAIDAVMRGAQDYLTKGSTSPKAIERAIRLAVARDDSERHLHDRVRDLPAEQRSYLDLSSDDEPSGVASRLLTEVLDAIERAAQAGNELASDSDSGETEVD